MIVKSEPDGHESKDDASADPSSVRRRADLRIIPSHAQLPSRLIFVPLLICILICAMLGSGAMLDWAQSLPDGLIAEALMPPISGWNNAMQHIGMTKLEDFLHNAMQDFVAAKFPGADQ